MRTKLKSSVVLALALLTILTVTTTPTRAAAAADEQQQLSFDFNIKLTNVDSSSAEFEVFDNNRTTINYNISYKLTSNSSASDHKTEVFTSTEYSFAMQTNSATLLAEQRKYVSNDESADALKESMRKDDQGEIYTVGVIDRINSKSYEDVHRFVVPDLDPNR